MPVCLHLLENNLKMTIFYIASATGFSCVIDSTVWDLWLVNNTSDYYVLFFLCRESSK